MRKLFLGLCLLFSTVTLYSQTSIIPKVGLAITSADADPEVGNQESRQSILFGLGIEAPLSNLFSVQPEILYIQKGVDWKVLIADTERRINYIELPVMFKLNLPVSDFLRFYVNAGPSLSFALSGEDTGSLFGFSGSRDLEFGDGDGELKALDVGLQLGAGVGYTLGNGNLLLDFRYGHGLTDLQNNADATFKNRTVAISVGYAFTLNGGVNN